MVWRVFSPKGSEVSKAQVGSAPILKLPSEWAHSTVPSLTASMACRPGTISPGAKGWIWNPPSVISLIRRDNWSEIP